jgi:hypothetical protein
MESGGAGVALPIAGLLERSNSLDPKDVLLAALRSELQQIQDAIRSLERFNPRRTGGAEAGARSATGIRMVWSRTMVRNPAGVRFADEKNG